jgi:hypothetical protein
VIARHRETWVDPESSGSRSLAAHHDAEEGGGQTGARSGWRVEIENYLEIAGAIPVNEKIIRKFTRDEIIATIHDCAAKLGHVPTFQELTRTTALRPSNINRRFGSYTNALRTCGLKREGCGIPVTLHDLFYDWARVVRDLGKVPTLVEYEQNSNYSQNPLRHRYGSWNLVPAGMLQYARENGLEQEWADVLEIAEKRFLEGPKRGFHASLPVELPAKARILKDRPLCGTPLIAQALGFAPVNEMGVVFLFGAMARQLGFIVTSMGTPFPDSEAFREVEPGRWQHVRIEIEFQSRNFLQHLHDPKKCDLIVCWEHNWPECPLEVVELKGEIARIAKIG